MGQSTVSTSFMQRKADRKVTVMSPAVSTTKMPKILGAAMAISRLASTCRAMALVCRTFSAYFLPPMSKSLGPLPPLLRTSPSTCLRRRSSKSTASGLDGLKRVKSLSWTFLPSLEMDFCRTGGKKSTTAFSRFMPCMLALSRFRPFSRFRPCECMTILAVPAEQPVFPACGGSHQMLSMSAIWISYCLPLVLFMMASAMVQTSCPNSGFKASFRMAFPAALATDLLAAFSFVAFSLDSLHIRVRGVLVNTTTCIMLATSPVCASTPPAASCPKRAWPSGPS
mmetsp:Transcript_129813/g.403763  ORF Transcript_129813/g.403763 Transcript_129813/m.403763 type:complete len:282 (-) Transcript_129813:1181-2026(-)